MTKPSGASEGFAAEEESQIKISALREFFAELQNAKFATESLSAAQKDALKAMADELKIYAKEIEEIEKDEAQDASELGETDPIKLAKKAQRKQKNDEKTKKLAEKILVISCASTLQMDRILKFRRDFNLKDFDKANSSGINPLMAAIIAGRSKDDLKKMLDSGANINAKIASQNNGNIAHFAVMIGANKDMINSLVNLGVNINAKDDKGFTPLDIAVSKGDKILTNSLRENGATLGRLTFSKEEQERRQSGDRSRGKAQENVKSATPESTEKEDQQKLAKQQKEAAELAAKAEKALQAVERVKFAMEALQSDEIKAAQKAKKAAEKEKPQKSREQQILEKALGVDLDKVNVHQLLLRAVENGQSATARFLIDFGADVNYREGENSVLRAAAVKGNGDLVSLLATRVSSAEVKSALTGSEIRPEMRQFLEQVSAQAPQKDSKPAAPISASGREIAAENPRSELKELTLERSVAAQVPQKDQKPAAPINVSSLEIVVDKPAADKPAADKSVGAEILSAKIAVKSEPKELRPEARMDSQAQEARPSARPSIMKAAASNLVAESLSNVRAVAVK